MKIEKVTSIAISDPVGVHLSQSALFAVTSEAVTRINFTNAPAQSYAFAPADNVVQCFQVVGARSSGHFGILVQCSAHVFQIFVMNETGIAEKLPVSMSWIYGLSQASRGHYYANGLRFRDASDIGRQRQLVEYISKAGANGVGDVDCITVHTDGSLLWSSGVGLYAGYDLSAGREVGRAFSGVKWIHSGSGFLFVSDTRQLLATRDSTSFRFPHPWDHQAANDRIAVFGGVSGLISVLDISSGTTEVFEVHDEKQTVGLAAGSIDGTECIATLSNAGELSIWRLLRRPA